MYLKMANEGGAENQTEVNRKVTIKALGLRAWDELSSQLNYKQCIRDTKNDLYPDWRGLFKVIKLPEKHHHKIASSENPTFEILSSWCKIDKKNSTIETLFSCLEEIDRYGLIEDIEELICQNKDIENFTKNAELLEKRGNFSELEKNIITEDDVVKINEGLSLKQYDALVLFVDDDMDFAVKLIQEMESKYNMELCVKDRDMIAGGLEYTAMMTLITERCNRLIVILSPAFFKSPMHQFYLSYANFYSVETQKTKVILCMYKDCYEEMPAALKGFYVLNYERAGKLWNYWDRLSKSLRTIDPAGTDKFLAKRSPPVMRPDRRVTGSNNAEVLEVNEGETVPASDQHENTEVLNCDLNLKSLSVRSNKSKLNFLKVIQQKVTRKGTNTKKQGIKDNVYTGENPVTNKNESLLSIPKVFNVFKKDQKVSHGNSRDGSKKTVESKNKKKGKGKIAVAAS